MLPQIWTFSLLILILVVIFSLLTLSTKLFPQFPFEIKHGSYPAKRWTMSELSVFEVTMLSRGKAWHPRRSSSP